MCVCVCVKMVPLEQTLSSPVAVAPPHGSVFLSDSIILTSPEFLRWMKEWQERHMKGWRETLFFFL